MLTHVGRDTHRLQDNPKERRFAEAWQKWNDQFDILEYLCGDGNKRGYPSDEDIQMAATVIQWLGSPAGQEFLRDLGYEETRNEYFCPLGHSFLLQRGRLRFVPCPTCGTNTQLEA